MQKLLSFLFAALVLAGCATPDTAFLQGSSEEIAAETEKQKQLVLEQRYSYEERLQRTAFPLLTDNVEICKNKTAPYLGFSVWTSENISPRYRGTAERAYGLDEQVSVYMVVPGSPAAQAGLLRHDKITSVNGRPAQLGKEGMRQVVREMRSKSGKPLGISFIRDGKEFRTTIDPVRACNFPIVLENDGDVNAFADGKIVHIPIGMLRFASADDELALVMAHEIAHNAAGHIEKKMQNALGAGLVGALIEAAITGAGGGAPNGELSRAMAEAGGNAYSVEFEQEADYIGMYMLARAGYPINDAANFWRRMASEASPDSVMIRSTHPTSPERFIAIEKTVDEIASKISAGAPLIPNTRRK